MPVSSAAAAVPAGPRPAPAAGPRPEPARAGLCLALLVALGFSLGCSEFVVIGIEPQLADAFGVTLARAGQTIGCFAIAYAALTPVLALCTGRFRRHQLLVGYSAVFVAGNAWQALASGFAALLASRVLIGAVSGALLAVGITYIPELVGVRRTSRWLSVVYAAFSVAMVVATSAGKLVADLLSWRLAPVGTLVLAVVVCVALVCVMPRCGATDEVATAREQLALFREPCVAVGMAIFVFGVGSVYVFYGYVTPYLEQVLGLGTAAASAALMGYGVVTLVSNLASGWLDARFGMRALLVTFPAQALVLLALFVIGGRTTGGLVAIMLVGLSMYLASVPCVSMFMATARERCPKALTLASSLEPVSFNVGIAFGTVVGGGVVGGLGLAHVGLVGACFSLLAWGIAAVAVRLGRRRG